MTIKQDAENRLGANKTTTTPLELSGVNELDNDNRVRILGIIDKFRELGINEDISLPQLVVVGDQSSGKSSLLEGLTGLSFPVASDLCTRFATQIVLRRAPEAEAAVRISIIPGPTANADEKVKEKLLKFGRTLEANGFGSAEFKKLLDEAADCMGLPNSQTEDLENLDKRFSDDILKIELSGPEHRHLSVVDVPGLFHNPTKYQTVEDRAIIRNLIEGYITDKRTIILAVMDARNNLANQEVFHMARAADPEGIRTVGIITKCDALQEGDEQGVLKIARNEVERLNNGWFAVRNRSTQDIANGVTISQRHANERKFFRTAPWNELRKDRVGVSSLKSFLGQLLFDHIRKEFPGLVKEIQNLVAEAQKSLEELGPSRQTSSDQRRFLTRVATKCQEDVRNALSGNYPPGLELNDDFASDMTRKGHWKAFRTVDGEIDPEYDYLGRADDDIYGWIRTQYREYRGAELPGTYNPALLKPLFCQQSSNWRDIAVKYIDSVIEAVSAYNKEAFEAFITDDEVRRKLCTRLETQNQTAMRSASIELDNLLKDEQEGILQTVNHCFADTLARIREKRMLVRLESMGLRDGCDFTVDFKAMMRRDSLGLSNEDQAVNDIHDTLRAYYKVALKRFMDNVVLQTAERHLLGVTGPVKIFSPEFVGDLSESELADIAAENYSTSVARTNVNYQVDRLQKALEIAKQAGI